MQLIRVISTKDHFLHGGVTIVDIHLKHIFIYYLEDQDVIGVQFVPFYKLGPNIQDEHVTNFVMELDAHIPGA